MISLQGASWQTSDPIFLSKVGIHSSEKFSKTMFGATAVRQKRERERRERMERSLDLQHSPYVKFIKPYGARFDKNELPYFKYRQTQRITMGQNGNNDGQERERKPSAWEV